MKRATKPFPHITNVLAPRPISRAAARSAIFGSLGFLQPRLSKGRQTGFATNSLALCGEALRLTLWKLSKNSNEPVYVSRWLSATRPMAAVILETPDDIGSVEKLLASLEQAKSELAAIGDVAALPRGRWLPAPLRCVHLQTIGRWILLGGRPMVELPGLFRDSIEHNGVARLLSVDPRKLDMATPVESEDDWIGVSRTKLSSWAQDTINSTIMLPFDDPEASFECYAPNVVKANTQYHRWLPVSRKLPDMRYLARPRFARRVGTISLVEIRRGQVVAIGTPQVEDGDLRQLLYGLDAIAGKPTRVRITRGNQNNWAFELKSELPTAEHRLLTVLGRLRLREDGSYYPRFWDVPQQYVAAAVRSLQGLGIVLDGVDAVLAQLE